MRKVTVALGLVLLAWVALCWSAPGALPGFLAPGVDGLDPGYARTYAAWEAAFKTNPDEALAIADEFLLGPGASGPDAQSVWGLRMRALGRASVRPDSPAERGQLWRVRRIAARRPIPEWIMLATAGGLLAGALISRLKERPLNVETSPAIGPRPWQNLPKPMMD